MDPKLTARGMSLKLRVELGKLPMQRLALASYVGDPDACAALTALAAEGCGEAPPDRPESFDLWLPGLKAYGQGVVLRTSLAFSRLALLQWREIRRELKEKSAGHLCYPLAYDLVIAAEACLAYRLPDRLAYLTKTLSQAEDAPYDLHHSDNLPRHAQLMALFVHTARIVLPLCWSEAFDAIGRNLHEFWPKEKTRRNIVRTHLIPWALYEQAEADPILEHPTQSPRDSVADP